MALGSRTKGILSIIASAAGFSAMAACVRLADDFGGPVSSVQKSFFRNVVAFAIAAAILARRWRSAPPRPLPPPRECGVLLLRCFFGTCGIFAHFYALGLVPIAEAQTLNKTAPFFTVALAWAFLGERAGLRQAAALSVAFCGVLLVAKPGFAGEAALPLAAGLLGGLCAGAAYVCLRALRRRGVDPALIVAYFSAFSCLACVPFLLRRFDPMAPAQVAALLAAGAFAAVGQFGVTAAYGYAPPREIAVFDYTSILFTSALGFAMFGQIPDCASVAGFALVVAAAFILNAGGRRK